MQRLPRLGGAGLLVARGRREAADFLVHQGRRIHVVGLREFAPERLERLDRLGSGLLQRGVARGLGAPPQAARGRGLEGLPGKPAQEVR